MSLGNVNPFIVRVLAAVVAADGSFNDRELITALEIYRSLSGEPIGEEALRTEAQRFLDDGVPLERSLAPLTLGLNALGRRKVFQAAFAVACADGYVAEEENQLLKMVAAALRMPQQEFAQALDELAGSER